MGGGVFSAIESQNKRGGLVTMLQRRMLNKSVELRLEIERSRLDADKRGAQQILSQTLGKSNLPFGEI